MNRNHLAAKPITELANLRQALFGHLRESFEFWRPYPLHASAFGSVARGDGDLNSDVDIFLVRPADVDEDDDGWRRQEEILARSIFEWTGNHAGISAVSEEDLERLRRDRPAIVESLRADAVDLAGTPLRKLLGRMT